MAKKTLLKEGTIRRFMKLAEMEPLAGNFINEMFAEEAAVYQDDEGDVPVEDDFAAEEEIGDVPAEGEEELDVELDMEEEPVEDEEDLGGGEEAGELSLTDEEAEAFLKVADKVRAAMDAAPEGEELEAPDMGAEEELDMGGEEEFDVGGEEELDMEPPAEEVDAEEEELVQEIARRVAKRLLTKKNK
jgi:hypothetical protein